MAVRIFSYEPIYIHAGFRMECMIDSQEDKTLLQNIFVDLCCRCLDKNDLLFGYDDENNVVQTLDYPVNEKFFMVYNNSDDTVIVTQIDSLEFD